MPNISVHLCLSVWVVLAVSVNEVLELVGGSQLLVRKIRPVFAIFVKLHAVNVEVFLDVKGVFLDAKEVFLDVKDELTHIIPTDLGVHCIPEKVFDLGLFPDLDV
jgi:hypothetical protein